MDAETSKALAAFGFLTVLESSEHGLFGGYLVLSPQGRPLEFRCSTPVVASRAQEILYGPTLRPYLLSDVIGQSLLAGSELPVEVVLTDHYEMLALALVRPEHVLHVEVADETERTPSGLSPAIAMPRIMVNGYRISMASECQLDAARIESLLRPLQANVSLGEPFERIRAALTEAQVGADETGQLHRERAA